MLSNDEIRELQPILVTQSHLLERINEKVNYLEDVFKDNNKQSFEINNLEKLLDDIETNLDLLDFDDFKNWDENIIHNIYSDKLSSVSKDLEKIEYEDWDSFVKKSIQYCVENNIEPFVPYESFLSKEDLKEIEKESYKNKYKWDKWDYIFVGTAGVLAALTDFFLVAIPKDMTTGVYKGQKGSDITKWLQSLKLPPSLQKWLEDTAKVAYDNTGGSNHRIDTFGHDPVIGFIIGVIDIMRGGATTIKKGNFNIESGISQPILNPIKAIVIQFLHLASDVATKKGLPVPFATVFRALKVGSFNRPNGKTATISDLTLWMYHHGYDLRHFLTMSITPATIEIILRAYILIRQYCENDGEKISISNNPKYRSMLLSAHAIASATNAGKVALYQGNPLAINYAEWLALLRYLVPSMKYWLFDKQKLKIEHMENINDNLWNELTTNSYEILRNSRFENMKVMELGNMKFE